MQPTRFDFDVISGPVPPRIPLKPLPASAPAAGQATTPKQGTGK